MNKETRILIIGASGQVGQELLIELRKSCGAENVIATDIKEMGSEEGPFEILDVLDKTRLTSVIEKHKITQIYQLAALLSATAEQHVEHAWKLNMQGLFNVLDLAKDGIIEKVFWPSSIAVFGPNTPKDNTPQFTITEPNTVYGISKLAGERWCEYYHQKYNVDVRSLRYPGLIGYKSNPGGGTTDYAVHIFHEAIAKGSYECFLAEDTTLPMMFMPDAVRATIELMEANEKEVKIRSSYNVAAMSFSPTVLADEIRKHIPEFEISYLPDSRDILANSWPRSIDDNHARNDWNWQEHYTLQNLVADMLKNLATIDKTSV